MNNYTSRLIIAIPVDLLPIGRSIARALDPDVGGYDSYMVAPSGWVADTPCTADFAAQAMYLIDNPEALHAAVVADYALRWPQFIPPTLSECEVFCDGVVISTVKV